MGDCDWVFGGKWKIVCIVGVVSRVDFDLI